MNFWERDDDFYKTGNNDRNGNARQQSMGAQNASFDWQERINEYAGKSQDELMQELLGTAGRLKGEGKLSAKELDSFYERVSAFLNDEQKERMRALIEMLKR